MNKEQLQSKHEKLVSQLKQLQEAFQKLEAERSQIIANIQAHNGAIAVLEDMLKESDASNSA